MFKYVMGFALPLGLVAGEASAQVVLDRADPTIIERSVPPPTIPSVPLTSDFSTASPPLAKSATMTGIVRAITVTGQEQIPPRAFAEAIAPVVGQELSREDLTRLAGAVADIARKRGYPFASATIPPQSLTDDILRVTLDLGKIDAVRVIGGINGAADRILAQALADGEPVRQGDLERALLLVSDLPGVRVKDSRFVRQDGFGILLVTIENDRASAYIQFDNRGSKEVGPIRSTMLGSLRNIAGAGDEAAIIIAQTPLQPSEFAFLRGRYSAPVDAAGTVIAVSGSVARSEPGGILKPLNVVGRSADVAIGLQHPLLRRRAASLWAATELRTLGTNQMIVGNTLRRDRITTMTGTLNGNAGALGGLLRGELTAIAGLGGTRKGSPLASRVDGDAQFVTLGYAVDWTASLGRPFSIVVASAGQMADRPLLATVEFGVGGPGFGRAYDYAERTGDNVVVGSIEIRADTGRILGSVVDRVQLYGFFDGGTVHNLRGGFGGGTLASAGGGARIGTGTLDWLVELAMPLNADRFDTGDRSPRVSLRLARVF